MVLHEPIKDMNQHSRILTIILTMADADGGQQKEGGQKSAELHSEPLQMIIIIIQIFLGIYGSSGRMSCVKGNLFGCIVNTRTLDCELLVRVNQSDLF